MHEDLRARTRAMTGQTYLLHDAGLALGKGNVATRLVLDELDLNLATLAAGLVVVVVVLFLVARALDAAIGILLAVGAIVVGGVCIVVDGRRRVLVVFGDFGGHGYV